jgi:hypothetical protein
MQNFAVNTAAVLLAAFLNLQLRSDVSQIAVVFNSLLFYAARYVLG